jgi:hypothetical protein
MGRRVDPSQGRFLPLHIPLNPRAARTSPDDMWAEGIKKMASGYGKRGVMSMDYPSLRNTECDRRTTNATSIGRRYRCRSTIPSELLASPAKWVEHLSAACECHPEGRMGEVASTGKHRYSVVRSVAVPVWTSDARAFRTRYGLQLSWVAICLMVNPWASKCRASCSFLATCSRERAPGICCAIVAPFECLRYVVSL